MRSVAGELEAGVELSEMKERSRTMWGLGDYAPTGRQLEPVSVALVESLGIGPGQRVLDVAAGLGNCALAAARRGADVVASDFSPVMLERGRARTEAAGFDLDWREADAAALPFEDDAFDVVTSVFGAIFAPEQEQTARELVRVTAPGGVVGLTTWAADGLTARFVAALAPARSADTGAPPDPWGDAAGVERLFAGTGSEVTVTHRTVTFTYPSWEAWRTDLEAHGMWVARRQELSPEDYEAMVARVREVIADVAVADGDGIAYDSAYLEIRVDVRS